MPKLMSMNNLPMFCDTNVFSVAKLTPKADAMVTYTVLQVKIVSEDSCKANKVWTGVLTRSDHQFNS